MLKEHNLGELLDLSIRLYFKNIRLFLAISALSIIPSLLPTVGTSLAVPLITIPAYALSLLVSILVYGALTGVASAAYLEKPITFSEALRLSLSRYGALLVGSIIYFIAVALGLLLIIPGIYYAVAFQFYYLIVIVESLRASEAVSRSRKLVKGSWWRVFGITMVLSLLSITVLYIILIPVVIILLIASGGTLQGFETPTAVFVTDTFTTVVMAAILPFIITGETLLYYDLRIRREGFDLEVKAEDLTEEVTITT